MSEPGAASTDNATQPSRQRRWERIVVVGAILLLVGFASVEWRSREGYGATLRDLEQRFAHGQPLPYQELQNHVRGFAMRTETTHNDVRVVTLSWPSLVNRYRMNLPVYAGNMISVVDTSPQIPQNLLNNPTRISMPATVALSPPAVTSSPAVASTPAVVSAPPAQPDSVKDGLPQGYEQVVAVTLSEGRKGGLDLNLPELHGLLAREVVRQSVIIAAEEELGLTTIDPSIGEAIPKGDGSGRLQIQFKTTSVKSPSPTYNLTITLSRNTPAGLLKSTATSIDLPRENWLEPLVEQIEAKSRKEFVDGLLATGFKKSETNGVADAGSSLPVDRMDSISQFAMVRALHAERRSKGQTSQVLAGLVRAYANLGNQIDFHWSPASKAFKARSLLYAQRLVTSDGATPFSLAHRAYAQALTGRHGVALATIQSANRATGPAAPGWIQIIDAYCDFKPDVLDAAQGTHEELAQYLRMRMAELADPPERLQEIIQRSVKANPACFRTVEKICEMEELGMRRLGVESAAQQIWGAVYLRMEELELPNAVQAAARAARADGKNLFNDVQSVFRSRIEVIRQLEQSTGTKDHAGPSWSALADLLHEATFAQVWRVLDLELRGLGVPSDESLQVYRILVAGHRHEAYLDTYGSNREKSAKTFKDYIKNVDPYSIDACSYPMVERADKLVGDMMAGVVERLVEVNGDEIAEDQQRLQAVVGSEPRLLKITPKWPEAIAEFVRYDRNPPLREWEQTYSTSPTVLWAISHRYQKQNQVDDAVRCLEQLVKVAPMCQAYLNLGRLYQKQGDEEKWLDALEQALKKPSFGLAHAQIHADLAMHYSRKGEWNEAKPHAIEAAESYSEWGLMTAAQVHEGLNEWEEAEEYVIARSQRYAMASAAWYFWCIRTGHGHLQEARDYARQYWRSPAFPANDPNFKWQLATDSILEGRLKEAREFFVERHLRFDDMNSATYVAILADAEGDTELRDKQFRLMERRWAYGVGFVELTNLFRGVASGKEECKWNPQLFDQLLINANSNVVPHMYYTAGMFLGNHGEPKFSEEYLQCAATSRVEDWAPILAADALQKRKIAVGHSRWINHSDSLDPIVKLVQTFRKAYRAGQLDESDAILTEALKLRPECIPVLILRGQLRESREKYEEALADYDDAHKIDPNNPYAHASLAWLLSTCERDDLRDGKRALQLAEQALLLRQFETAVTAKTLASAHAECGSFDQAITMETKAQQLPGFDSATDRLKAYQARRPFRQKPKPLEIQDVN